MSIQPLDGQLGPSPLSAFAGIGESGGSLSQAGTQGTLSGDAISRMVPPWLAGTVSNPAQTALFGPLPGLLQQLVQMLQQLMGGSYGEGCNPYGGGGYCPPYGGSGSCAPSGPYGNERFFQSADGASEGDPHLSFNGQKWNSMTSHPDLLNSNSFQGGFRISTQVTSPNAHGATKNQSATISLDNGQTTISMNNQGQASIDEYGRNVAISAGQTIRLGNGTNVTENQDGSLVVDARNGYGGRIETTLAAQGQGVNVDVSAHDVDLGGALVRGPQGSGEFGPSPGPIPVDPWPGPTPGPVATPDYGAFGPSQPAYAYDFAGL